MHLCLNHEFPKGNPGRVGHRLFLWHHQCNAQMSLFLVWFLGSVKGLVVQCILTGRFQVRNTKALVIQKNVRGFVQRRKFQREMRGVVLVQASVIPFHLIRADFTEFDRYCLHLWKLCPHYHARCALKGNSFEKISINILES